MAGEIYITHYGGEFFASNYMNAVRFISCAEKVFDSMKQKKFQTSKGDEFIVSLVANPMLESVKKCGCIYLQILDRYKISFSIDLL